MGRQTWGVEVAVKLGAGEPGGRGGGGGFERLVWVRAIDNGVVKSKIE